ncbi:hypothetical protein EAJ11_08325 [Bacteroides uniformis]|nr:hypothetical protein EAJ11_08325 [Bacteroides uniformis]
MSAFAVLALPAIQNAPKCSCRSYIRSTRTPLLFFPFGRWWAAGRSFPFSKASLHGAVGCKV